MHWYCTDNILFMKIQIRKLIDFSGSILVRKFDFTGKSAFF